MEKIGLNKLREMFLGFFESKDHYRHHSFSLVPEKDKSLLIINSGMAPLKPFFSGTETPPSKRMTTCQKCIRTGDIENVGYTARHGTFFEMLGNFSFGDYFKEESLSWGWEFIIDHLKLPEERIWASIYEDDDEAYDIWKNIIRIPEERIVRLGKDDNFWEIGTGPCGPCSEIYFDRGAEYGCDNPDCKPGCDCDRYIEFWNHVFTQFSKDDAGNYSKLANPNIDTGLGLERLACIMQGVDSIFDVDTIRFIVDEVCRISGTKYENGAAPSDVSIRIITDHIRSITFMIGDRILPSNEGRGYVLRRLLRRAARHGRLLGVENAFLANLSKKVIEVSGEAYPELNERAEEIQKIIAIEEEKFAQTIDQGMSIISGYIRELNAEKKDMLDGEKLFKLYDTYGFPPELTEEILKEHSLKADFDSFEKHMEEQKNRARASRKEEDEEGWAENDMDHYIEGYTDFSGYDEFTSESEITAIFDNKKSSADTLKSGDIGYIVTAQTPFYAESGGQAADIGIICSGDNRATVLDVQKKNNIFFHKVEIASGEFSTSENVTLIVNEINRNNTRRNHSATHLLHSALRQVLGDHINQAGSSVTADSLRFDFTHYSPLTPEEIKTVEDIVNNNILLFMDVATNIMNMDDAIKKGATALFDEKYGDKVRVVSMGDVSMELCGGTHVLNTGQIGMFKITSEYGIAAGTRRIEAVTGSAVLNMQKEEESIISELCDILKSNSDTIIQKAAGLKEENKELKKENGNLKKGNIKDMLPELIGGAYSKGNVKLITKLFDNLDQVSMMSLIDDIRENSDRVIIVFANRSADKASFAVSVSDDLLSEGFHAGNLIKEIAAVTGGKGGGKADIARAGAGDVSKLEEALEFAKSLI